MWRRRVRPMIAAVADAATAVVRRADTCGALPARQSVVFGFRSPKSFPRSPPSCSELKEKRRGRAKVAPPRAFGDGCGGGGGGGSRAARGNLWGCGTLPHSCGGFLLARSFSVGADPVGGSEKSP